MGAMRRTVVVFLAGVLSGALGARLVLRTQDEPSSASTPALEPVDVGLDESTAPNLAPPPPALGAARTEVADAARSTQEPAEQSRRFRRTLPFHRDLVEVRAALEEALAGTRLDTSAVEGLLAELGALGTPEAVGLILDVMQDPEVSLGAAAFHDALRGVEDPRIAPAAVAALQRNVAEGLDSWVHTHGFLDLIAEKGNASSAMILANYLLEGGQLAVGAAEAVSLLRDRTCVEPLLALLGDDQDPMAGALLADGLASWGDPAVTRALYEHAFGPGLTAAERANVVRALAAHASPTEAAELAGRYWSAPTVDERAALLHGLRDIGTSNMTSAERASLGTPLLAAALAGGEPREWSQALSVVADTEAFHTREMELLLEAFLPRATGTDHEKPAQRALARVRSAR